MEFPESLWSATKYAGIFLTLYFIGVLCGVKPDPGLAGLVGLAVFFANMYGYWSAQQDMRRERHGE